MQRFELVEVFGRIIERLGVALFKVRLSNGHEVVSHLSEELLSEFGKNEAVDRNHGLIGSEVLVRLRAFDLSSGAIVRFISVAPQGASI